MKRIIIIFFFLLISCSSGKDLVDIDAFIKQGKVIDIQNNDKKIFKNFILKKIDYLNNPKINNWSQINQNTSNLIPVSKIDLIKDNYKTIQLKQPKIIYHKNLFVIIDQNSNLSVYDSKLKKIKSVKLYKRKIYKDIKLNFSLSALNNFIFVSDNLGNIHCVDLEELKIKWVKKLGVPLKSEVKIYKQNLYVINTNSKIYSLNTINGNINWSFETASKLIKDYASYQISIHEDKLFFVNDYAQIYCIDLNSNKVVWSNSIYNNKISFSNSTILSSPIIANDNKIYFSNNHSSLVSINSQNGQILWSQDIRTINIPLMTKQYIFALTNDELFILNKNTGKVLNYFDLKKSIKGIYNKKIKINFKKINLSQNKIYLFNSDGEIFYINLNNLNKIYFYKNIKNFNDYIFTNKNFIILRSNSLLIF